MTFENGICQRCTRRAYLIVFGQVKLCDSCFDTVSNDPETEQMMKQLMKNYGTN